MNDATCYGFKWGETNHECTLLAEHGLCLETDPTTSVNAFVKGEIICSLLCQGNTHFIYKVF